MPLPSIFKSYDIRGLSPEQIDSSCARRLGKVLARIYASKRVLIGRDMRATSPELEEALIDGLRASGVEITKIGLCSTPMFYATVGEPNVGYDFGVMVTASHNPTEYNGFKLVDGTCRPIGKGSGMEEIEEAFMADVPFLDGSSQTLSQIREDDGALDRYLDRVFALANLPNPLPEWTIAVDAGNGMGGLVMPGVRTRLPGMHVLPLYWDLDGRFPNHEANPIKHETLLDLQEMVKKNGCAFGVALDGDGDRIGFVDEQGEPIPGDMLTALFAIELLRTNPGATILYDVRSSWSVPEAIAEHGGVSVMCRVGHAHIKKQMREVGAKFAGELSMHFYFADFSYAEASEYAFLLLVKILIASGKPLSALRKDLQRYVHSGEINFSVTDVSVVMQSIDDAYGSRAAERLTIDGVRYEFRDPQHPENDWWFNVRASNTEPVLRLNLEARTNELMEAHREEIAALIRPHLLSK